MVDINKGYIESIKKIHFFMRNKVKINCLDRIFNKKYHKIQFDFTIKSMITNYLRDFFFIIL